MGYDEFARNDIFYDRTGRSHRRGFSKKKDPPEWELRVPPTPKITVSDNTVDTTQAQKKRATITRNDTPTPSPVSQSKTWEGGAARAVPDEGVYKSSTTTRTGFTGGGRTLSDPTPKPPESELRIIPMPKTAEAEKHKETYIAETYPDEGVRQQIRNNPSASYTKAETVVRGGKEPAFIEDYLWNTAYDLKPDERDTLYHDYVILPKESGNPYASVNPTKAAWERDQTRRNHAMKTIVGNRTIHGISSDYDERAINNLRISTADLEAAAKRSDARAAYKEAYETKNQRAVMTADRELAALEGQYDTQLRQYNNLHAMAAETGDYADASIARDKLKTLQTQIDKTQKRRDILHNIHTMLERGVDLPFAWSDDLSVIPTEALAFLADPAVYYGTITISKGYDLYSQPDKSIAKDDWDYAYINNLFGARTDERAINTGKNAEYRFLSADEVGIYNYLHKTEGKDAANQYLSWMATVLNQRYGDDMYSNLDSVSKAIFWLPQGLDRFSSGIRQLFSSDALPTSAIQVAGAKVRQDAYDLGGVAGFAYDLGTSASAMLPTVAVSYLAGPQAGAAVMGASSAGNAYKQKLDEGWTKEQASAYATLIGVSEATLQTLIGGIDALGGEKLLTGKALDGLVTATAQIDNAFVRFAVDFGGRLAIKGMPEAFENGAQAILDAVFEHIIAGEELDIDWGDIAYEALEGLVMSVILNAPEEYANTQTSISTDAQTVANADVVGYTEDNAAQQDIVLLPPNDSQIKHIFADREGHLSDTPENRQLILDLANDPSKFVGVDSRGKSWNAIINSDGTQTWVRYLNGTIINGGKNAKPRPWNTETGFNTKPEHWRKSHE